MESEGSRPWKLLSHLSHFFFHCCKCNIKFTWKVDPHVIEVSVMDYGLIVPLTGRMEADRSVVTLFYDEVNSHVDNVQPPIVVHRKTGAPECRASVPGGIEFNDTGRKATMTPLDSAVHE